MTVAPLPNTPTLIIDTLFGIGLSRPVLGIFKEAIQAIRSARTAGARVLAVDIPSGIFAATGETLGAAVEADLTVTFARNKLGLTIGAGKKCAGRVVVKDIGIP